MTETVTPTYRTSITVAAPAEKAFKVFTEGFDTWWPRSHHIAKVDMAEAIIEPRVDGRWYERGVDGSECVWGQVLAWDPPRHVALSWHLNGQFEYDPDPAKASRVEVTFTQMSDSATEVELVHTNLDRHDNWAELRSGIAGDGGWPSLMQMFGKVLE